MAYVPAPGTGALFSNERKDAAHAYRPDYRGTLTLPDGSTLNLAGWVSDGETGKYLSLKVSAVLPPVQQPD